VTLADVTDFVWGIPRLDLWGAALGVILTVMLLGGLAHVAMGADRERRQQLSLETTIERVLEQHGLDLHAGDPRAKEQPIDLAMYARLAEVPDPRKLETATPEEIHRCYDSVAQKDPRLAGRLTRDAMLRRRAHLELTGG
jgi:hypothetical protein